MMTGEEILQRIADWDLVQTIDAAIDENRTHTKVYVQLQTLFTDIYANLADITRIKKMLDTEVQDFVSQSDQVKKVAAFLKEGAENQTQDIKHSMSLIENFSAKINAIYEKTQNIISLAHEMEKINQNVQTSINQLVDNQEKNDEAMEEIFSVIRSLIDKTEKIDVITKLINRISSETNLLGLNAKVEAVHAGAYGKGFSVVANEIQRLSNESKNASVDISDTIKSITDEIDLLEKVAMKSKDIFNAQRESVTDVNNASEKNSDFIGKYLTEQEGFYESIDEIKSAENVLVDSISNVFSTVREVSATAQEIATLNFNQNNSIALLKKLSVDMSGRISSFNRNVRPIQIRPAVKKRRKIAILFDSETPFWDPMKKETVKTAEVYDYDINFFAPKSRGIQGLNEMVNILDTIMEEKYDGLIISPINDPQISQKLKTANQMGIKIVFLNAPLDNVGYTSLIYTDGFMTGATVAKLVTGILGNTGEVIVNSWNEAQLAVVENRRIGFVRELKKISQIAVHEVGVPSKSSLQESEDLIGSILNRYPKVKVVFLTNFDWGLFFANYKKKHHSDIQIIVVDYIDEVEESLKEGLINYAIGQRAYSWGTMGIGFIDDSLHGRPVPKVVDTGTFEVNQQTIKIYTDF